MDSPEFVTLVSQATYSCGDTVEYACEELHNLHGSRIRTCDEEGRWSGAAPVCADLQCPSIDTPDNGGMRQANGLVLLLLERGYETG